MKKKSFIVLAFLILSVVIFGCQKAPNLDSLLGQKQDVMQTNQKSAFLIAMDAGLWKITHNQKPIDWKKLDKFYRDAVANPDYQKFSNFDGFKQLMLQNMVQKTDLLKRADLFIIEYYLLELMKCKGQNPEVAVSLLTRLSPRIGQSKIKTYAQKILNHNARDYKSFLEPLAQKTGKQSDIDLAKTMSQAITQLKSL